LAVGLSEVAGGIDQKKRKARNGCEDPNDAHGGGQAQVVGHKTRQFLGLEGTGFQEVVYGAVGQSNPHESNQG